MEDIVTTEFTELLRKYISIDDQLREGRELMNKLNTEKRQLSSLVSKFMKQKKIDELNLPDSKLSLSVVKTTRPLTKKIIQQRVQEYGVKFLNDPERAKHMIDYVTSADFRESVERTSLKRFFKKKSPK